MLYRYLHFKSGHCNYFVWYNGYQFYATDTYITHFLEAARFPKAPVLAGRKVNFTLRPAKSAVRLTASPPLSPATCQALASLAEEGGGSVGGVES